MGKETEETETEKSVDIQKDTGSDNGANVAQESTARFQDQADQVRRDESSPLPKLTAGGDKPQGDNSLQLPNLALIDNTRGMKLNPDAAKKEGDTPGAYDFHQNGVVGNGKKPGVEKKPGEAAEAVVSPETEKSALVVPASDKKPGSDPEVKPETEKKPGTDPEAKPEAEKKPGTDPEAKPEAEKKPGTDPEVKPETDKKPGADPETKPESEKKPDPVKHMTEQQEKDAQVRRGEGPYQVAARLLGKDATHEQKMALVNAMKEQYKTETENKDPNMRGLAVGRSLLNEGNFDKVMGNIKDKSMQDSISAKLDQSKKPNPEQKPKPEEPPKNPEEGKKPEDEKKPEDKKPEEKKPEEQKKPEDQKPDEPKKPEKKLGPLGTEFVEAEKPGRKVETIASVYGDPQGTSSGRRFDPRELTAAIKPELAKELGLKHGDVLRVTHEGKSIDVVYTDAGPFVKGRGIDLSTAAGKALGITVEGKGIGKVEFQKVGHETGWRTAPPPKKR